MASVIKFWTRQILKQTGHLTNLNALLSISDEKLFLPFYHIITDEPAPHIKELYSIRNTNTFNQDIKFLTTHYSPITIQELHEQIKSNKLFDKPSFHLTFDDGLKEMLNIVAPILKEQNIPATFFINSAFVDNKDLFFRYKASLLIHHFKSNPPAAALDKEIATLFASSGIRKSSLKENLKAVNYTHRKILDRIASLVQYDFQEYLKKYQPYLTTDDILQLKQMGFTIGAHSVDHPNYYELTLEDQCEQTQESIDFVKRTFDLPYSYFSFPFSDEKVSNAFFRKIFSSPNPLVDLSFGISGLKKDSFATHLHRFPMEGNQQSAEELIKTEYLYYIAKSLIRKNHITRKWLNKYIKKSFLRGTEIIFVMPITDS